jgi:hypothetical protein
MGEVVVTKFMWVGLACLQGTTNLAKADLLWGANGHPITAYPGIRISQQLDYLQDLGMRSYRVNISNTGKAGELAALVKEAKARGIEVLPVITPGDADLDKDSPKELYDKAYKLAVALGSRFKDDIRVWELGNEMENYAIIQPCEKRDDGTQYPCEWGPAGGVGALEYYGPRWAKVSAVLKGLSDGMISVDPKIRKAMGTAGWGHVGAFERMKRDGIEWDISVWHTYGEDPEWAFEFLVRYGRPIWVTEFNNPYGSQRSERQQAEGLKQAIARLRALQGTYKVEAAYVYELLDETYWAPSFEASMGLVKLLPKGEGKWTPGEPKPAYFTVRDMLLGPRPTPTPHRACELAEGDDNKPLTNRKVGYSYCLVLGRAPDGGGLESWAASLDEGKVSMGGMILAMLKSDEFNGRYATFGLSDAAYVNFIFQLLLGREADPGGQASYVGELRKGAMTRAGVAASIIGSSEFKDKHPVLFGTKAALQAPSAATPG